MAKCEIKIKLNSRYLKAFEDLCKGVISGVKEIQQSLSTYEDEVFSIEDNVIELKGENEGGIQGS